MRGVVNAGKSVERVKWLWTDDRIRILVSVAAGWLLAIGVRLVFPAVLPSIRAEFGMSISMAGFLLSTLWMGYALMQFPGGVLADEFGERYALASSSVVATVGIAGVIAAPSTVPLFSASTVIGLGVGIYGTTRLTVIGDVFPDRSGTAVGVCQAAGNIGTTFLPPVAGLLAVALGWRWGFIVILPFFVLVGIGLWTFLPERTSQESDFDLELSREYVAYVSRGLFSVPVILVTITLAFTSFIYQSFTGFFPLYLSTQKGVSSGTAATLLGAFFATGILLQPIAGAFRDRFGARITLVAVFTATAIALSALPFLEGLPALIVVTFFASIQLAIWPISNSYIVDVAPADVQGTVVGLARTAYLLFGAIGPIIIGIAADGGRFDAAIFGLAGLSLLGVLPAARLTDSNATIVLNSKAETER